MRKYIFLLVAVAVSVVVVVSMLDNQFLRAWLCVMFLCGMATGTGFTTWVDSK